LTAALERIGFMQGRLSALVDGKIQAFPWNEWHDEFPRAKVLGLTRMEWTIDQDRLRENPLTTRGGPEDILALSRELARDARNQDRL
jgi:L-ribulose-5-phosphate 3-epimerase